MQFFDLSEIDEWCRENGGTAVTQTADSFEWKLDDNPALTFATDFWYDVDTNGAEPAVSACLDVMGTWDECLLWIVETGVFSSHEDWPAFYALRGEDGERMSIGDRSGHLFSWKERERLHAYLSAVVNNLWDALILPAVHGQPESLRLKTSHHECVDLWSSTPRTFSEKTVNADVNPLNR